MKTWPAISTGVIIDPERCCELQYPSSGGGFQQDFPYYTRPGAPKSAIQCPVRHTVYYKTNTLATEGPSKVSYSSSGGGGGSGIRSAFKIL
jgi:hypothetical protein